MTAELAVALPAVVLVLAACLGALRLGVEQIRLTDAAALAARSLARADPPGVARRLVAEQSSGRIAATGRSDGLVCVQVRAQADLLGTAVALPLTARSCALAPWSP